VNNQTKRLIDKKPINSKTIRNTVLLIALLACLFLLINGIHILRFNDFIEYWSAAKAMVMGGNPYNPDELIVFQKQGGLIYTQPIMMYNPPWTLALVALFGFFGRPLGQLIWLLLHTSILLFCAIQIWKIYHGRSNQRWISWLVAFMFAPTILVLELGQITPFLLLGLIGFLSFIPTKKNDWAAGLCLVLVSIKPQLTIIFWFALLIWIIQQRRWLILLSEIAAILFLTGIAMVFNPHIIQQYLVTMSSGWIIPHATPTIGAYLRFFWLGTNNLWLQYVPAFIGGIWFIYYWNKHKHMWNWETEMPLLLLVSIVISPFAWTYDYVILLPVIIQAMSWIAQDWKRWSSLVMASILLLISLLDLILYIKLNEFWFIWMPLCLFIWYLLVRWQYLNSKEKHILLVSEFK
jgi:hypothetical protein